MFSSQAFIDIESQGELWLEWCAAMYESACADDESYADENDYSAGHYAATAHHLCEEIEYSIYDAQDAETHYNY